MKRRLLSLFLAFVTILSLLPTAAFAASSEEDALGEVDIYNGDYELGYLAINGAVKKQKYTYFLYESNDGSTKESPAYCVNPNQYGVPQTVGPGESIKYLANEKASDPKVVGIISNGYPHRSLGELGLENKYQAFYATKMALWCYLIPSWDISNLKVAPGLSGDELDRGNRILAAAKDIYKRGTTYNYMLTPRMTVTADKSTAYPVTIGGQAYLQQVFTVWSETWVYDYDVSVAFSDPDSVPEGTKIVDANNKEITAVTTKYTSDGYAGTFKVLYPAGSVEGQSGNVQFSLSAPVAQYAAMYAVCQEKDQYGDLQNYICDLDNKVQLDVAAVSSYADSGEPDPDETALKIVKLEEGTEIPLEGAVFSVYDLEGKKVGSFSTGPDGTVTIPLTLEGHYTITEEIPPRYHLLPEETTQHADVEYNKTATLTFWNAPYGSLRVEKRSDTGDALSGVTIQIKHIETGETRTGQTRNGVIVFDELVPGGWEVRELAGIDGWVADTDTVQDAVDKAREREGAITWTIDYDHGLYILSRSVRKVYNLELDHLGDLLVFVDLDRIVRDANRAVTTYGDSGYILFDGDQLIYTSEGIDPETANGFMKQTGQPYSIVHQNGHSYFAVKNTIPYYNWTYINLVPYDQIANSTGMAYRLILAMLIVGFIAALACSRRLTRYILKDFDLLIQKMEFFSSTELKMPEVEVDYSKRTDEISRLHQHFDTMAGRIQYLVQNNYVNQILSRDAKLKALESQINPHFLYNTLETINWRAKALKDQQISSMVESLGTLLRATLSNKKPLVSLDYEISLAGSYMTIQKIRFEDRLLFHVECPEELGKALILPLTIQPLLENAIRYGMEEMMDTCEISIRTRKEGTLLIVEVSNEGSVFEDSLLEKLQDGTKNAHGFGIGLVNIHQRIQMLFGDSYGLSFKNQDEKAIAIITIPYKTEEDDYA